MSKPATPCVVFAVVLDIASRLDGSMPGVSVVLFAFCPLQLRRQFTLGTPPFAVLCCRAL